MTWLNLSTVPVRENSRLTSELIENKMSRPWFWRLWTAQELALALDACLVWADIEIPFTLFTAIREFIELRVLESNINSPAQQVLAELTAGTAAHHAPIRACQGQSNAGQMISLTRWLRASKAHDKVFALHGILTKLG